MMAFEIKHGDAIEQMSNIPDESVDLIVTDPPYESLEKWRKIGTTTRLKHSKQSSNDWFDVFPNKRLPSLMMECYRVLKKNAHLYIFCDDETSNVIWYINHRYNPEFHFKWWKRIVWDKVAMGMGYHYRNQHEFIAFLEKGKRKLNDLSVRDILTHKRIVNGYPGEKPVPLLMELIGNSGQPGETVLDPFCGSGSTGEAAVRCGMSFIGIDTNMDAVEMAHARAKKAANSQGVMEQCAGA